MKDGHEHAVDTLEYYDYEINRVLKLAFHIGKGPQEKGDLRR